MLKNWSGYSLLLLGLVCGTIRAAEKNEAESEARIAKSAKYLSTDNMQGRGVGTKGLNLAADFIRKEFDRLGLKTQFQKFTVPNAPKLGPAAKNRLALVKQGKKPTNIQLKLGKQFNPLAIGGNGAVRAPIVFAGYGITSKDHKYDDYAGLDVKGKVVLVIRKEPQQNNPHSKFNGSKPTPHAYFVTKVDNAKKHGAIGVIMVNDGYSITQTAAASQNRLLAEVDKLAKLRKDFKAKKKPTAKERAAHIKAVNKQLALLAHFQMRAPSDDQLVPFNGAGTAARDKGLPVFFASRQWADQVVKKSLKKSLSEIEAAIDEDLKPRSGELKGWIADAEANIKRTRVDVKNVIGVLEGEGPLANETIVVGAHYDHVGMGGRRSGSLAPWTRAVHNGADDNASGTASLIEVAHQLTSRGAKTRRRIVFIAFTAEEMGLLGSKHYCRQPLFPLDQTVAMFNMDMVGRLRKNKLVVYGTGTAKGFDAMVNSLNKKHGFKISKVKSGYGPSDHQSFYMQKIPVLHLFTATHKDYHRPSDDYNKLNLKGMQRIASFFTDIVLDVDERSERPKYVATKRPQRRGASTGNWPDFGSVPDYTNTEKFVIEDVRKDSPADKGGVLPGDVMIQFGAAKIKTVEDFARALGDSKVGQKVKVIVLRKGKKFTLTITLGKRK